MTGTTYLPSSLTGVDSVEGLKTWLDQEMEMLALHARSADISSLRLVDLEQGETIEEHTVDIAGLQGRMTTAEGDILTISATLTEETTFRISGDEALAQQIVTLQATLGEVSARIQTTNEAIVTESSALVTQITTLRAEMVTGFAQVTIDLGAYVTETEAYAWYRLTLDVNDYVSGFESVNDGASADFTFVVDKLKVAKAGVSGGTAKTFLEVGTNSDGTASVVIKADVIKAGSIITESMDTNAATAPYAAVGSDISDFNAAGIVGEVLTTVSGVEIVDGTAVLIQFHIDTTCKRSSASQDEITFQVKFGATVYYEQTFQGMVWSGDTYLNYPCIGMGLETIPAGTYTVTLVCSASNWTNSASSLRTPLLFVAELRR